MSTSRWSRIRNFPFVAVLAAVAFLAAGTSSSTAAVTACSLPSAPGGGLAGVTLSVANADGSVATADGTGYMPCVFANGTEAYSIVVAKSDGIEDLGADNLGRTFTLRFTLTDGQSATSAELYADVQSYTIGENGRDITLVMRPVTVTSGTDGDNPAPLQDSVASIVGGIRFNTVATGMHGITGMWIGASANRYSVALSGSCPSFQTGGASGSTAAGVIEVRLWAPHMTAGTYGTPVINTGSLKAFIPEATASACFGGASLTEIVSTLEVARSAAAETTTALIPGSQFTASAVAGGLLVNVPTVTFSSPTYRISAPGLVNGTPATSGPKVSARAKRTGAKAVVTVTVPAASVGKRIVITEIGGKKPKVLKTATAKAGANVFTVKVAGRNGKAKIKVTLAGKTIANLKV